MNKEFEKTIKYLKKNRGLVLKTLLPVVLFCIVVVITAVLAIKPNDNISPSNKSYLFENRNPNFNVAFGSKEKPDKSYVRFEARVSDNPFEQKDRSLWESVTQIFSSKKGFEFGLSQVRLGETNSDMSKKLVEQIGSAIEQMQIDDVTTDTEVIEVGRLLGEDTDAQAKKTVINKDVYPGIDVEYQILEGLGVKEEIVIRNIDEYTANCGSDRECLLPLNEFVFDLKLDEGLLLKESMAVLRAKTDNKYYITDSDDSYIAHFLPTFAVDGVGSKTTGVGLDISNVEGNNYEVVVTLDVDWLFSNERVFPIRIDPSIVHDTTTESNTGSNYNTEVVTGPKVQLKDQEIYNVDSNVVGYWKLNETSGSGAYILDSSGNGYNGTPTNTTYTDGKFRGGRKFVTTVNKITVGDHVAFEEDIFTIDAYINRSGGCNYGYCTIFSKGSSRSEGFSFGVIHQSTAPVLHIRINDGGSGNTQHYTGSTVIETGEWYHVAAVVNSTTDTFKLYVNGKLEPTPGSFTETISYGTASVKIGNGNDGDDIGFNGIIDEVRFSNVERTAEEVSNYYISKIQGAHTSAPLDMGTSSDIESITWTPVGDNTGDGETPYSTTGLVGQWNFNESSGTTAVNEGSCGSSCNGTLTNMTTTGQDVGLGTGWTKDKRRWGDGALMFDGGNDYVSISSNTNLRPSYGFSVEAWVNTDKIGGQYIISHAENGGGDDGWGLRIQEDGRAAFNASNANGWYNQVVESGTVLNSGEWYHLVGIYDSSYNLKIYINGRLENTKQASGSVVYSLTDYVNIGRRGGTYNPNSYFFDGTIDSLRFYTRALTASEIVSNYQAGNIEMRYRTSTDNSTWSDWSGTETDIEDFHDDYLYDTRSSGLVSYWPMEESSGTAVGDVTGTNQGTASGAYITDGKFGNARTFDGINDYISVPDSSSLRLCGYLTLEMWYKSTKVPATWSIPVRKDTQIGTRYLYGFGLDGTSGGRIYGQYYNGSNFIATYTSPDIFDGNWHHVVMTTRGSPFGGVLSFYFDGVLKESVLFSGTCGVPTGELNIGASPPWTGGSRGSFFEGSIDEVRISNTVATASQIYERWAEGSSNATTLRSKPSNRYVESDGALEIESSGTTVDANTIGYWKLDEPSGTGAYIKDSSSYSNNGTPSGATFVKEGKVEGARSFDGVNDIITVGTTGRPTNNFTVETWFTTDVTHQIDVESTAGYGGTSGQKYLFGAAGGDLNSVGMGVSVGTNGISVYEHGSSYYMPALAVYSGTVPSGWNHLAVVYNNKTPSIYLNGALVRQGLTSLKASVYTPYQIGGGSYGFHSGKVDEVRFSNRIRSADEIAQAYAMGRYESVNKGITSTDLSNDSMLPFWIASDQIGNNMDLMYGESLYANYEPDANTVGLWHLDENYNIANSYYLKDSSGNGNYGGADGSAYNVPPPEGIRGLARTFNGTDGVIKLGTGSSLSLSSHVTLDAWIKIEAADTDTAYRSIIGNTSGSRNYNFYVQGNGSGRWRLHLSHNWNGSGFQGTLTDYILDAGKWHHVTGMITISNGGSHYYYVDGKLAYSSTNMGFTSIAGNTLEKRIGSDNGGTWFYGVIDEVRISNIVRTPSEIRQAYEVGRRTHPIIVDFKADLQSPNLISSSSDKSFTISEQGYGTINHIENIDVGEKIVVKENVGGIKYIAQGDIATVNTGTGAVTVNSWDSGSTFPSGGFTINSTVFKWQREYIDIRYPLDEDINAITNLTFRKTTDVPATFWIDDMKKATYSSDYNASSFSTIEEVQYVQYQPIFTRWDSNPNLDLYRSEVDISYFSGPTNEQLMRHGKWFDSSGVEQPFWWVGDHSTPDSYTVTYARNPTAGGTLSYYSQSVDHGTSVTGPTVSTNTGYTFTNFTITSGSCAGTFNSSTGSCSSVTGAMTIQANWSSGSTWTLDFGYTSSFRSPFYTIYQTIPENVTLYFSSGTASYQICSPNPTFGELCSVGLGSTYTGSYSTGAEIRIKFFNTASTNGTMTIREDDGSGRLIDMFVWCIGSALYCGSVW